MIVSEKLESCKTNKERAAILYMLFKDADWTTCVNCNCCSGKYDCDECITKYIADTLDEDFADYER